MSRRLLLVALAGLASVVPGASAFAAPGPFGTAILHDLNVLRARHGLPPVRADNRMGHTASAHSQDMQRHQYFAHGAWSPRVAKAAGRARDLGEVLGWLEASDARNEAKQIVHAWLVSREHRRVMLDSAFRRVGIGRAAGPFDGRTAAIYTVDFASTN